MTREELINQRATSCRHGGHCEWVACDKCKHYEPKPETITNSTSGYLEVVLPECEDAISRQVVKDIICSGVSIDTDADKEYVCELIDKLPSVKPKEKTGKWIDDEFGVKCSCCGRYTHLDKFDRPMKFMYCSMCGAKMEVSE